MSQTPAALIAAPRHASRFCAGQPVFAVFGGGASAIARRRMRLRPCREELHDPGLPLAA